LSKHCGSSIHKSSHQLGVGHQPTANGTIAVIVSGVLGVREYCGLYQDPDHQ